MNKAAFRQHGGKAKIAPWICQFVDNIPHIHYVETFGGAASVLILKKRSRRETFNELDSEITNFFQVLRDQPDALIEKLKLTPWSQNELEHCINSDSQDPIEKARVFYTIAQLTIKNWGRKRYYKKDLRFPTSNLQPQVLYKPAYYKSDMIIRGESDLRNQILPESIIDVAINRFQNVQITNLDFRNLTLRVDGPSTLFYHDPPYLHGGQANDYKFNLTEQGHIDLINLCKQSEGMHLISGYDNELYNDLIGDWARFEKKHQNKMNRESTEVLWLNEKAYNAYKEQTSIKQSLF